MDAMFRFEFGSRKWIKQTCSGGHAAWTFGHAAKRGQSIFAFGTGALSDAETPIEVSTACGIQPAGRQSDCAHCADHARASVVEQADIWVTFMLHTCVLHLVR